MSKKQALVKRSNGNINITIENNLKANQNSEPIRRRRRKRTGVSGGGGTLQDILKGGSASGKSGGGIGAPPPPQRPYVDVSYIRPPPQSYSIWNDTTVPDPNNMGIGYAQAQQMGIINPTPQRFRANPQTTVKEEEIPFSQQSRYTDDAVKPEVKEEELASRYKNADDIGIPTQVKEEIPFSQQSRYTDVVYEADNDEKDEEIDTSKMEASLEKEFEKSKKVKPTKEQKEKEKKDKLEFQKMLLEKRGKKVYSDEEVVQEINREYFKAGVAEAKKGNIISKDDLLEAPEAFLEGYNSVSEKEENRPPAKTRQPSRKSQREKRPVERFKP